ncbi:MAG: glucose-6-phosphate dehydrogenase [Acidimicrobiia bacterium]|nr:MAG: glucose-6-phosphate dehydrogenase [Acidimicrobiia bacterium]
MTFVVFGATGHLARTKLLPALANVVMDEAVPRHALIGVGSRERTDEEFREIVARSLRDANIGDACRDQFLAAPVAYRSVSGPSSFENVESVVGEIEDSSQLTGNRVLYLAIPPSHLDPTVEGIHASDLNRGRGWNRLVVEKPFGVDLESAKRSNELIHQAFDEKDVFRIDHFLAKETVRNLLVFRFANSLFEQVWNRRHVESVEITVAESAGVEGRAAYYDESGAVRDMLQNHLAQIMTLVAMEPPVAMTASAIRSEKVKVLQAARPILQEDAVLGRYTKGELDDTAVLGYLATDGVNPDSSTPTYAAIRVHIDNWRWQGVPFYLRTGKRMSRRLTEVVVRFRKPPVCLFHSGGECRGHQNVLRLRLQPDEGFELLIDVKRPGDDTRIGQIPLAVSYDEILEGAPTAYETLLADVLIGDQTLFVRSDEVEASWKLFAPLLDRRDIHAYAAGTDGPHAAGEIISSEPGCWSPISC